MLEERRAPGGTGCAARADDLCGSSTPLAKSLVRREPKKQRTLQHVSVKPPPAQMLLALPDGVTVTATSLLCSRKLSVGELDSLCSNLWQFYRFHRLYQLRIGDAWVLRAADGYGKRKEAALAKKFAGKEYETLMNWGSVARKVETSRRNEVLDYEHHVVVAPLPPAEQTYWLNFAEKAEKEIVPAARLRREIAEADNMADRYRLNALNPHFIEDEEVRDYLRKLKDVAEACLAAMPPWKHPALKGYLKRYPNARQSLIEVCASMETLYCESGEFFRDECDEASSRVEQQTTDELIHDDLYELEQAAQYRLQQWTKAELKEYLVRHSRSPKDLMRRAGTHKESATYHTGMDEFYCQIAEDVRAATPTTITQERSNENSN